MAFTSGTMQPRNWLLAGALAWMMFAGMGFIYLDVTRTLACTVPAEV